MAAAAAATASKATAQPGQKAARPPARPQPKNARHALEPNPFEQSFSSKPSDSASPPEDSASTAGNAKKNKEEEGGAASSDDAVKQKAGEQKPASSSNSSQDPAAAKAGARSTTTATGAAGAKKDAPAGTSTPDKRALPPVASLTSPNQEGGNVYPWGPSSLGSLRAGPLSPAMLTGPQHHLSHLNHFDPSTFRTGFTPDLSNFKTGLTPLGSASGFPPPSPGTAAFLAMVNGNGPQMTPNTFTALTNHASSLMNSGDHTGITPMQSDVRSGQNGSQNQGDFDLAFGRQQQQQQQAGGAANARQKAPGAKAAAGNGATSDTTQQAANKPGQPKLQSNGQTQGGGPQGAAGLFLLSQAHQELSKRDQQQAGQGQGGQVQQPNGMVQAPQPQPPASFNGQQGASAPAANGNASKGTKRKKSSATANASSSGNEGASGSGGKAASSAGPAAAAGAPAKNAKKAKRGAKSESVEDDIGGSDGESGDESKFDGEGGSPGDDEEKRKNFLERNRQAALKCRQRKKAWLQDLQTKVAFYEAENGGLQETVGALRNEVMFLKSQLMQLSQHQHQQAGGMPLMPPGMLGPHSQQGGPGVHPQQYGPPQGARGPSQGASYSPASQAA